MRSCRIHGRWRALLLVGAGLTPAVAAQTDRPGPRFESQTDVIQVDVVVTGKNGVRVLDLTREDVVLLEDGKPQVITHFVQRAVPVSSPDSQAQAAAPGPGPARPAVDIQPRLVILAVDTPSFDPSTFLRARRELVQFVDEKLGPEDQVAVATTTGLLCESFTTDRARLRRAIENLSAADMSGSPFAERPEMTTYQANAIVRNDRFARQDYTSRLLREDQLLPPQMVESIMETRARRITAEAGRIARNTLATLEALIRPLAAFPGRKTLMLVSNGFFTAAEERGLLQEVTSAAARAGVVIYSLEARGLAADRSPLGTLDASIQGGRPILSGGGFDYAALGTEADRQGLNTLARDTGGLPLFEADLSLGLKRVLEDTASGYVLGYQPSSSPKGDRYRKIEVQVRRPGVAVRTQRGYLARGASKREASGAPANPLRDALVALVPQRGVPIDLAGAYLDTDKGPTVAIAVRVPGASETTRRISIMGVVFDDQAKPLSLFEDEQEQKASARLTFDTHTVVTPGRYQVRVAATDGTRFGATSVWIEVPDLARGGLALTDLFVAEGTLPPRPVPDRYHFPRATPVELTIFACNVKADEGRHADVVFDTRLSRESQVVSDEPPFTVTVPVSEPRPPRVGFSRSFVLSGLEPGEYSVRIKVTDRIAKVSAEKQLRFRLD